MACKVYPEDGRCFYGTARHLTQSRGIKRQLCTSKSSNYVRLDFPSTVSCSQTNKRPLHDVASVERSRCEFTNTFEELPNYIRKDAFIMNNMDEITYWIYTRRPPCLMKYDLAKKQNEQAQCSKPKISTSIHSISDETKSNTPKKKKRKLSILDDESDSVKEQKNLYFDSSNPQKNHQNIESSKSETVTDTDFNIKKSSVQVKHKLPKLQRNSKTTIHKKNKIYVSTPKNKTNLRRSVRNSRKSFNESNQLNNSFDLINVDVANIALQKPILSPPPIDNVKLEERCKKTVDKTNLELGPTNGCVNEIAPRSQKVAINGDFENVSDVSGFTANYIRSTKNMSKNCKNIKSKNAKHCVQSSRQTLRHYKTVACAKTPDDAAQETVNQSRETSQNHINFIKSVNDPKVNKTNLQLIDSKHKKSKQSKSKTKLVPNVDKSNIEITTPSPRRYPKRNYNNMISPTKCDTTTNATPSNTPKKRSNRKIHSNSNVDSPLIQIRQTRSGRSFLNTTQDSSQEFTETISSPTVPNAGTSRTNPRRKTLKDGQSCTKMNCKQKISVNKSERSTTGRDSIRDKSGFAACFSDSDDDKPLKTQKYFC